MTPRTLKLLLVFALIANLTLAATDSLAETRKKAEAGNANAQFDLGFHYECGDGVRKDLVEAVKWYRKAAEQGLYSVQYYLGDMYSTGKDVPKDSFEAVKWFSKAAEQGSTSAQVKLGLAYAEGEGVPKNLVQAHVWINLAGANGDESARVHLLDIESKMTFAQKAEAMKLAREMWGKMPKKP